MCAHVVTRLCAAADQGKPVLFRRNNGSPYELPQEEIREAMSDYGKTQFGGWPWTEKEVVHSSKKGRFALHSDGRKEIKNT